MPPKEIRIDRFTGLDNVTPPELREPGALDTADNVDIDQLGKIRRRKGATRVYNRGSHSLWSDGSLCLFRQGANLNRLNADFSATALRSAIAGSNRMNYLALNGLVYFTDDITAGIIQDGSARSWGLEVPPEPVLSETAGDLPEGRYQVSLTYCRKDYQESGASRTVYIDISEGGIEISSIPVSSDPAVQWVNVYLSTTNGEALYLARTLPNGTTSTTYKAPGGEVNLPLKTQALCAPFPGQLLEFYNGRIYIARDNFLFPTEPMNYELIDSMAAIPFPGRITLLAPVEDGIWLSIEGQETVFLSGDQPQSFKLLSRAPYSAIEGTARKINAKLLKDTELQGDLWIWGSSRGICLGAPGGAFSNLTHKKYSYPFSQSGSALVREERGMVHYLLSMDNAIQAAFNAYS